MSSPPAFSAMDASCRVTLLTPVGRGAIAVVAVDGPDAAAVVSRWFQPAHGEPLESRPVRRIVFGRWQGEGQPGEDVVVCRRSPVSVEIHCHGGPTASAAIADCLASAGCRRVEGAAWATGREADPLAAEARIQLAAAPTLRTAAVLLDQYRGALRNHLERILEQLRAEDQDAALAGLRELTQRAAIGLHLTRPWRVVVAGPPNVGKSSLINALLGYRRSVVHPAPGATRDIVAAQTALDGWPAELADTAGLRESDDPIEAEGVSRARNQMASADLTLMVRDASRPASDPEGPLLKTTGPSLAVYNKCDLEIRSRPGAAGLLTSARTKAGIDRLIAAMVGSLAPHAPPAGAAVPFTPRQRAAIQAASDCAGRGQFAETAAGIERLLRRRSS